MTAQKKTPAPKEAGVKVRISGQGRLLLREGCVAIGVSPEVGERLADWLDSKEQVRASIEGAAAPAPFRVFGPED